jgi:hypothetical protein
MGHVSLDWSGRKVGSVSEAEASSGRSARRGWIAGFLAGALAGLALGLAVGPTGAALLGFKFPYLRLSLGDASAGGPASAPGPVQAAAARPSPQPAATHAQPLLATAKLQPLALPDGRVLTIGVFGDSMADGLWSAIYRDLHKQGTVDVLRLARNSTGLTRYDYVDVQAQTQGQLAEHHVDIAVIMFGTNDGQGIIDNGKVYPFATPDWRRTYAARIEALVGLLRQQGAVVYWVGLPRMERADFDRRTTLLNQIFEERATALGVPFISTVPVSVDPQGRYGAYLADPGDSRPRLMRAPDGIHMTMAGYLRLAGPVVQRIQGDFTAPPQLAVRTPVTPTGPVEAVEQP